MSIEAAVAKVLKRVSAEPGFTDQLQRNQQFNERMIKAGVVTRKQEFSIPLMERIARSD